MGFIHTSFPNGGFVMAKTLCLTGAESQMFIIELLQKCKTISLCVYGTYVIQ